MKYRALVDIPPNVKVGDIVEVSGDLVPEFKKKLEQVGDDEQVTILSQVKTDVVNPSLDDLKEHMAAQGIEWHDDMTVVELFGAFEDKRKEAEAKQREATEKKDDDEGDGGGSANPDRNELKAKAAALGITFAQNIPTDRLVELIAEAEAKE